MRTDIVIRSTMLLLVLAGIAAAGHAVAAAASGVRYLDARVDLEDRPSLQRGAKLFVNYCLSCHSASFMRYSRMARDLGIDEELVEENMLFTTDKVGSVMTVAMREDDAERWFGAPPPDLSVIARARGADYLYTFLMTFYRDDARATGANNLVFKDVAMPHVLAELQGAQVLREPATVDGGGHPPPGPRSVNSLLELKDGGSVSPAEYRGVARDLTNFLVYMGEPAKLQRYKIGFWVLVFLAVFYLLARSLYREYWKDVH